MTPTTLRHHPAWALRRRHVLLGVLLALTACGGAERWAHLPCLNAQLGRFSAKLTLSWHCRPDSKSANTTAPRLSAASR